MNSRAKQEPDVFIEFGENSVHLLAGEKGWDGRIERDLQGNLSASSVQSLQQELGGFLHRHSWSAPRQVYCSIPARGVSIRKITVPASSGEEIKQVLALQIEAQLPLAPEELAWGFLPLNEAGTGGDPNLQSFLVAAVKRETLQSYRDLFAQLQLEPVFVIAAFARLYACEDQACGILDVGETKSEFAARESNGTVTLRVIPWGRSELFEIGPLVQALKTNGLPQKMLVSGVDVPLAPLAAQVSSALQRSVEVLEVPGGPGRSAANAGLQAQHEAGRGELLVLETPGAERAARVSRDEWKWAIGAGLLLMLLMGANYLGPILQKPRLARELAELKSYRASLPQVERELTFLEFIRTNQPPYLDTIYLLADASQRGLKLESLTIGRRGDVSLRGKVNDPDGANQFRSKLVDSGFFSRVVIEEQTPDQNRREVKFRITAEVKPEGQRKALPEPDPPKTEKPKGPARPPGAVPPPRGRS